MDHDLFWHLIGQVVVPLNPNVSSEVEWDNHEHIVKGPVIIKIDCGSGRLKANITFNS